MPYKKIINILIVLCGILACTSCLKTDVTAGQPVTSIDPSSVVKVDISNDEGSNKCSIKDTAQISEIIKKVNDLKLSDGQKNTKNGYVYWIDLYNQQGKEIGYLALIDDESISMNGYLYKRNCKDFIQYISSVIESE